MDDKVTGKKLCYWHIYEQDCTHNLLATDLGILAIAKKKKKITLFLHYTMNM